MYLLVLGFFCAKLTHLKFVFIFTWSFRVMDLAAC